jgi:hypothetical protein
LSYKQNHIFNPIKILTLTLFIIVFLISFNSFCIDAQIHTTIKNKNHKNFYIQNYAIIHNSDKNVIMIGSIAAPHNLTLTSPVEVTIGLNVYNNYSKKHDIIKEQPFKNVIYNVDEPIPFKFKINPSKFYLNSSSVPYIYSIKKASEQSTKINTFTLKYNEAFLGPSKELYGTVTNTAPNAIKNLTLYAIVHGKNGSQIDSVKTTIPFIKSQQTVKFSFVPNSIVKDLVSTYSCVGGNLQDINAYQIIKLNSNKTIGYKFSGFMEIDSINYNNKTDQFRLNVNNIYPISAALSLQLTPLQKNLISIKIDGNEYNSKIMNNKETSKIELLVPQGKHEINIQGINS